MGESSSVRARCASAVSNLVTILPPRARFSVLAARKMVSPSGISIVVLDENGFLRRRDPSHVKSRGGQCESAFFQEATKKVFARGDAVDGFDQQTGPASLTADRHASEFFRKRSGNVPAVGLVVWQEDANRGIASPEERGQPAVDEDYA